MFQVYNDKDEVNYRIIVIKCSIYEYFIVNKSFLICITNFLSVYLDTYNFYMMINAVYAKSVADNYITLK